MNSDDVILEAPVAASDMLGQLHRATRRERDILSALIDHPGATATSLSAELSLHANTVREHLSALRRRGLVTVVESERGTPGRPEIIYYPVSAVPGQPLKGLTRFVHVLAAASHLEEEQLRSVGGLWADELISDGTFTPGTDLPFPERLQDVMRTLGFAPTPAANGTHFHLHTCPLRAGHDPVPTLMCRLHQELLSAIALTEAATTSQPVDASLTPAASKGLCTLQILQHSAGS